jgi:hypothetical protein
MKTAPDRIKIAAYLLSNFAQENNADLLFFSSQGKGKLGKNFDWNFAIYFRKKELDNKLSVIRQELLERTSPYHLEIINLNSAPLWMKIIIKNNYIRFSGNTPEEQLFFSQI